MGLSPSLPARGWESLREWRSVVQALRRVGADDLLRRSFGSLSGGEQRRVLLARALVSRPRLLLLDEPLSSLDPGFELEFIDQLRHLKRGGTAMVAATHHLGVARELADRVILLRRGEVPVVGPATELMTAERLDATYGTDAFSRQAAMSRPSLRTSA
jgi:ABC-type cobalamin/Fe3+-siderophores transport system ATPase subunit